MNGVFEQVDEALERVQRLLEQLLTDVGVQDRAVRLAVLFESEARLWSQLFELSSLRLVWRAALAAETLARQQARGWRQRADAEASESLVPVPFAVGEAA